MAQGCWRRVGQVALAVGWAVILQLGFLATLQHAGIIQVLVFEPPSTSKVGVEAIVAHGPQQQAESSAARSLTATDAAADDAAEQSGAAGAQSAPLEGQMALFFMFDALILGVAVLHLTTFEAFRSLQHTSVLFLLGLVYSVVHESIPHMQSYRSAYYMSWRMWMDIPSQVLLFTMLPPLILGDAMTIDTSVVRGVYKQCIFLAGPGVLFCAFLTALFLNWYLGWDMLLSLACGSMFSATDPVAVVSLLKDLGASPQLTVQIQGESVLNDGSSIVLFMVCAGMLSGDKSFGLVSIFIDMMKTAVGACGLGMIIGLVFNAWIRLASARFEHLSGLIQVCLTICCAYMSWMVAEGIFFVSGVLCTVSSALVLAANVWPSFVHKESMAEIWHVIEFIMNTIIFFLAGALTGNVMLEQGITTEDWVTLLLIYLVSAVVRFIMLVGSKPVLDRLGAKTTFLDLLVMHWGGLRGAVGLALAISLRQEHERLNISAVDANRILFFMGGFACLTLVINATSSPALVRVLGITQTPVVKCLMMRRLFRWLDDSLAVELVKQTQAQAASAGDMDTEGHGAAVDALVRRVFDQVGHGVVGEDSEMHLTAARSTGSNGSQNRSAPMLGRSRRTCTASDMTADMLYSIACCEAMGKKVATNFILEAYDAAQQVLQQDPSSAEVQFLLDLPPMLDKDLQMAIRSQVQEGTPSRNMLRATNEVMLAMVRSNYWEQVDQGAEFEKDTAGMLLASVSIALGKAGYGLADLHFILQRLKTRTAHSFDVNGCAVIHEQLMLDAQVPPTPCHAEAEDEALSKPAFVSVMMVIVMLNALYILVEDFTTESRGNHLGWILVQVFFALCFVIEFRLRYRELGLMSVHETMNTYELLVTLLAVSRCAVELGLWIAIELLGQEIDRDELGQPGLAKITKVLTLCRLFRFCGYKEHLRHIAATLRQSKVDKSIAKSMRRINALKAFVKAHVKSQTQMLVYFGRHGKPGSIEEAYCILESMTLVYRALAIIRTDVADVAKREPMVLTGVSVLRDSRHLIKKLSQLVDHAHEAGACDQKQAQSAADVLEKAEKSIRKELHKHNYGIMSTEPMSFHARTNDGLQRVQAADEGPTAQVEMQLRVG